MHAHHERRNQFIVTYTTTTTTTTINTQTHKAQGHTHAHANICNVLQTVVDGFEFVLQLVINFYGHGHKSRGGHRIRIRIRRKQYLSSIFREEGILQLFVDHQDVVSFSSFLFLLGWIIVVDVAFGILVVLRSSHSAIKGGPIPGPNVGKVAVVVIPIFWSSILLLVVVVEIVCVVVKFRDERPDGNYPAPSPGFEWIGGGNVTVGGFCDKAPSWLSVVCCKGGKPSREFWYLCFCPCRCYCWSSSSLERRQSVFQSLEIVQGLRIVSIGLWQHQIRVRAVNSYPNYSTWISITWILTVVFVAVFVPPVQESSPALPDCPPKFLGCVGNQKCCQFLDG
mmetsp:Transcript_27737/g.59732  ORF Transcript_27737/g.59732 Transcript_27737/m.59732 type:complete len:338 (+) Transcript_27737:75-1088(+)